MISRLTFFSLSKINFWSNFLFLSIPWLRAIASHDFIGPLQWKSRMSATEIDNWSRKARHMQVMGVWFENVDVGQLESINFYWAASAGLKLTKDVSNTGIDNSWASEGRKFEILFITELFYKLKCYALNKIYPSLVQYLNKLSISVYCISLKLTYTHESDWYCPFYQSKFRITTSFVSSWMLPLHQEMLKKSQKIRIM